MSKNFFKVSAFCPRIALQFGQKKNDFCGIIKTGRPLNINQIRGYLYETDIFGREP